MTRIVKSWTKAKDPDKGKGSRLTGLFALLLVLCSSNTFAQKTVTGTVSDESGLGLPGVTILVKGTTNGSATDLDGKYQISQVQESDVLIFTSVGMKTEEVAVGSKTTVDIRMKSDAVALTEVVAIGYVTRKKGEVTGSVSTISTDELNQTSNKDLAKSLSGKVTGVIVADRGGYPGSNNDDNMDILIRGTSTLNNNAPLILIDGIAANSFSHLSPQDIESLTVLKDGAAAIYGARAANGVFLITTKRGKAGKPKITVSSMMNYSKFSAWPKLMSSEQFATYRNEISSYNGTDPEFTNQQLADIRSGVLPNTNWGEETFADYSPESRTSVSISGGNNRVNYFVGGDFLDQTGMFKSGDLKFRQYQIRSNIDIKVLDNLKMGVDLSGRFGKTTEPGVAASYIYKHIFVNQPTEPVYNPDGSFAWGGENGSNPVAMSSSKSGTVNQITNNLRGKFSFDLDLKQLVEGLSVKGYAGIVRNSWDYKSWYTPWKYSEFNPDTETYTEKTGFSQRGQNRILRETFGKYDELMLNATIHYNKIMEDHTFRAFVGAEKFNTSNRNFWAERQGFPSENRSELFAGSDEGQQSYGVSAEGARLNLFAMASYDYKKKYFIDLTVRRDGSSTFAPGKRFGTFPGVALSWSVKDENFMKSINLINVLKIRASWAIMGNDRVDDFQYLTSYSYGGETNTVYPNYYIFGTGGTRYNGYRTSITPNPNITWETADMKNIGVNFALLDNRLTGDFNYFYQERSNILLGREAEIPDAIALELPDENIGEVKSFGLEVQVGWADKIGDLSYNIGVNFTNARNEVMYMAEAANIPSYRRQEGHPMNAYYVYPTNGIFKDQAEVDAAPAKMEGAAPGTPYYVDTNKDGTINAEDIVLDYSSNIPQIQYGVSGGISYKGINFNILFQGQAKAKIPVYFDSHGARPEFVFTERWTPENPNASYPRAFANGEISANQAATSEPEDFRGADFHFRDASFLRIKEVEIGYTFSKKQIKFGQVKIFARGFNLHTMFSDIYDLGLDPEARGYIDFRQSRYPSLKTYTFGFTMNF